MPLSKANARRTRMAIMQMLMLIVMTPAQHNHECRAAFLLV
jgi:hypothetical protein